MSEEKKKETEWTANDKATGWTIAVILVIGFILTIQSASNTNQAPSGGPDSWCPEYGPVYYTRENLPGPVVTDYFTRPGLRYGDPGNPNNFR